MMTSESVYWLNKPWGVYYRKIKSCLVIDARIGELFTMNVLALCYAFGVAAVYFDAGGIQTVMAHAWQDGQLSLWAKATCLWDFLVAHADYPVLPSLPLKAVVPVAFFTGLMLDCLQHVVFAVVRRL